MSAIVRIPTSMRPAIVTLALCAAALSVQGCASRNPDYQSAAAAPELLHASVQKLTDVIIYDIFSPPQASRIYAYASIAGYEAMAARDPAYRSLSGQVNDLEPVPLPEPGVEYVYPLAGVHAFLTVGRALTFSEDQVDEFLEAIHEAFRRTGIPPRVFDQSVQYGNRVAEHILAWSEQDYYRQTRSAPKFTVTVEPGRWRPTPPGYKDGIEPSWGEIRPFVLDSSEQFVPPPPTPFDIREQSPFYREVMEVYEAGLHLTKEQRDIAAFWDCNPYVLHLKGHAMFATKKMTPGGHWMGITGIASRLASTDVLKAAEAYARVSMVLADGFISSWKEKYRSNLIRPETVINQFIDEDWKPFLQTPPFPEYNSGHSVISAAAAEILTDLFGDPFRFTDTTEVRFGLPARSFESFREAADEAAISRLYGGIHFMPAIRNGLEQGRLIGLHHLDRIAMHDEWSFASHRPAS